MNLTKTLLAAAAAALFGGMASAATVTPDTYLGEATLGGGSGGNSTDVEIAALCDILEGDSDGLCGLDLELDTKFEAGELAIMQDDTDSNVFYVNVSPDTPGYFILKFGTGNTGESTHYFFENIADLSILAWDITASQSGGLYNLWDCVAGDLVGGSGDQPQCSLSHITTVIPVPAAGWLLLGGLGGLAAFRRRKS